MHSSLPQLCFKRLQPTNSRLLTKRMFEPGKKIPENDEILAAIKRQSKRARAEQIKAGRLIRGRAKAEFLAEPWLLASGDNVKPKVGQVFRYTFHPSYFHREYIEVSRMEPSGSPPRTPKNYEVILHHVIVGVKILDRTQT